MAYTADMTATTRLSGRIYFDDGNPWPEGHGLKTFELGGSLLADGRLALTLFLETDDYCANDGGQFLDNGVATDWGSKGVWNNYHACNMYGRFAVATPGSPISLDVGGKNYVLDPLPAARDTDDDDLAFSIYLLGHDTVAHHDLRFESAGDGYMVSWSGRIALSYAGSYEFEHGFSLVAPVKKLTRIDVPSRWSREPAIDALARVLVEHDEFDYREDDGVSFFERPGR